uniref:Uncharacterized protein n=1 Tax=Populus alba TaxID=43335 RepID=A0A4U5MBL5_POPAL|nr:hypothetical protein D5086_0000312250 [Populus alba]
MAKNKRKATSIVVPITKPDIVPCVPRPNPSPSPPSQPRDVGYSTLHPASKLVVASGSKSLDVVLVEDCSIASDEEILDEHQLDFNFSDEECDDPPQAPTILPTKKVPSPPPLPPTEKIPSSPIGKNAMPSSPPSGC